MFLVRCRLKVLLAAIFLLAGGVPAQHRDVPRLASQIMREIPLSTTTASIN
ncbi:hypothetical protein JI435_426630 [Parastagonospora nodorum SN15]|uniref:Uncharacterized protein n=1 Tax=Phaeosphaeria nodorum (strain SN15 / ATCC MYA-4574 / FGSC 10173) TaxID=321614 RepID=A0A7U2ERC4_PHANO|nr:hypothetical protein HBH72_100260 [Parastagonospora nodorum]KAH5371549.1 hypothetical protein HBI48_035410 [Parastagonospora nodorum]KAH5749643.1 hypothetical protein HBI17_101970 [Parastagonospora nodorum]QRC91222.1 hypothetical protein JI435_426630 [Parastagonospora nodorum SN15]